MNVLSGKKKIKLFSVGVLFNGFEIFVIKSVIFNLLFSNYSQNNTDFDVQKNAFFIKDRHNM